MNVFQKLFPSFDSLLAASADADHREREEGDGCHPGGKFYAKRYNYDANKYRSCFIQTHEARYQSVEEQKS